MDNFLMGYLTIPMLDATKHITDNFFFQEHSVQVHFACNTIQLSENVMKTWPGGVKMD